MAIYLDHAATTPLCGKALTAMQPYFTECYANPAGIYEPAFHALKAVENARKSIAACLGAKPAEIYFTAGGSESDNWALAGAALANQQEGRHLITTRIEHHAVLNTMDFLKKLGFEVTYLPVDDKGLVSTADLKAALRDDTIFVSVMHANNEVGTIEPIRALADCVREAARPARGKGTKGIFTPLFHTDGVQTFGHIPCDVTELQVDLFSASAHKFGGPKGVGFLYIKEGTPMEALIHGGRQERGLRGGTLNVPGIVGMQTACEEAYACLQKEAAAEYRKQESLRDLLYQEIRKNVDGIEANGIQPGSRESDCLLPGHLNLRVTGVKGESLVQFANMEGLFFSTGSACTTGATEPSHVLKAMGLADKDCFSSVRLTLGTETTKEEVLRAAKIFADTVKKVRMLFPFG